jgi:thiol-disulfide isomerase/thioredoxin
LADRPTFTHRPPKRGVVGPFSGRQLLAAAGSVVVAIAVLVAVTTPLNPPSDGPPAPLASQYLIGSPTAGLQAGQLAPDFAGTDNGQSWQLTDLDGRPIRLADLRGKAVWINFWASWCPPCQQETPILREVSGMYRDRGLVVVAVEVQETVDQGRRYAQTYGLQYTIGADVSGRVLHAYRIFGLPTQFFVAANGVIRSVVQGPVSKDSAIANVEAILADTASPASSNPPKSSSLASPSAS